MNVKIMNIQVMRIVLPEALLQWKMILLLYFNLITFNLSAQPELGFQAGLGLPVGRFRNVVKVGAAFDATIFYLFDDTRWGIGVKGGYANFVSRTLERGGQPVRYNFLPILAGVKRTMQPIGKLYPFLELDAGGYIIRTRRNIGINSVYRNTVFNYCLSPTFGVTVPLTEKLKFNIQGRYTILFPAESNIPGYRNSFVNLTIGLSYMIRKKSVEKKVEVENQ